MTAAHLYRRVADPKAPATCAAELARLGIECYEFAPSRFLLRDHTTGRALSVVTGTAALQAAVDAMKARAAEGAA